MISKLFNRNILPDTKEPMVLRADYSDDNKWKLIQEEVIKPNSEFGFVANVTFYENSFFDNLSLEEILSNLSKNYNHPMIFIADKLTFDENDFPIICLDLNEKPGQYFRVIPSEMWSIENNLSISNMDFQDFANNVDENQIFRGFK